MNTHSKMAHTPTLQRYTHTHTHTHTHTLQRYTHTHTHTHTHTYTHTLYRDTHTVYSTNHCLQSKRRTEHHTEGQWYVRWPQGPVSIRSLFPRSRAKHVWFAPNAKHREGFQCIHISTLTRVEFPTITITLVNAVCLHATKPTNKTHRQNTDI